MEQNGQDFRLPDYQNQPQSKTISVLARSMLMISQYNSPTSWPTTTKWCFINGAPKIDDLGEGPLYTLYTIGENKSQMDRDGLCLQRMVGCPLQTGRRGERSAQLGCAARLELLGRHLACPRRSGAASVQRRRRQIWLCGFHSSSFLKLPRQNVLGKHVSTNHNYTFLWYFLALWESSLRHLNLKVDFFFFCLPI